MLLLLDISNSLLIQWGRDTGRTHTDDGGVYFNLPTSFTNSYYRIIGSVANDWNDWEICSMTIDYATVSYFSCMICYARTAYACDFNYVAIGY